jgi:hypothetical protein
LSLTRQILICGVLLVKYYMYFCYLNEKFVTGDTGRMTLAIRLIDDELERICQRIKVSADPDSDGLCDIGEYYIGLGFVAIQQYFTESCMLANIDKKVALDLGPKSEEGIPIIALINACANWWKHEADWWAKGDVSKQAKRTAEYVMSLTEGYDYALSNVLASLCEQSDLKLEHLFSYLDGWALAVYDYLKEAEP